MSDSSPDAPGGKGFLVTSLGCKVNQAEAAWLTEALTAGGWRPAGPGEPVELAVLLTCSVTATAGRQSRQMAHRLARTHPGARVVVTGCDLQAAPDSYDQEGLTSLPRAHLARLPALAIRGDWTLAMLPPQEGPWCPGLEGPGPRRTRGLLKVQDGCDAACAYCIVPSTRGAPRSLPLDQAAEAFAALGEAGAAEVVLTGIHLGRWGRDLGRELTELLAALLAAHPGPRLRLSSLEAAEVTPGLLDLMAAEERICPHLHLPLQSGSDRVLAAMGRPYSAREYAQVALAAVDRLPGACLGADVLVGLPGEDAAAFQETLDILQGLPIAHLHVFPYSPRPGTPAAALPGRPPGPEARAQAARLRQWGQDRRRAFHAAQVGRVLKVVVEGGGEGLSQNYCRVRLGDGPSPGLVVDFRAQGVEDGPQGPRLRGEILPL